MTRVIVDGRTQLKHVPAKEHLVLGGDEGAMGVHVGGRGKGSKQAETKMGIRGHVVQEVPLKNVGGRQVHLDPEKIVPRPLLLRVGVAGQSLNQGKGVLEADAVGEPGPALVQWTREVESRVPISKMQTLLEIDGREEVCGSEPPSVVADIRLEIHHRTGGVGILRAITPARHLHLAHAVYI